MSNKRRRISDYRYNHWFSNPDLIKAELKNLGMLGNEIVLIGKTFCFDDFRYSRMLGSLNDYLLLVDKYSKLLNRLAVLYPHLNNVEIGGGHIPDYGCPLANRLASLYLKYNDLVRIADQYNSNIQ